MVTQSVDVKCEQQRCRKLQMCVRIFAVWSESFAVCFLHNKPVIRQIYCIGPTCTNSTIILVNCSFPCCRLSVWTDCTILNSSLWHILLSYVNNKDADQSMQIICQTDQFPVVRCPDSKIEPVHVEGVLITLATSKVQAYLHICEVSPARLIRPFPVCTHNIWASSWDYDTCHTGDQWRLRRACAVSPEPLLFAHMQYGSRRRVRPKIRHLASLDGCACTFEE